MNHRLQPKPDVPIPVRFIDLPPEAATATPPAKAKYAASNNSRAGGKARRDLPVMTGRLGTRAATRLSSSPPSRAQAKLLAPHPTQPEKLLPQPQPAPVTVPLSPTSHHLNSSPPVAEPEPKRQSSKQQASPRHRPLPRPQTKPVIKRTEQLPNTSRLAFNRRSNSNPVPPIRHAQNGDRQLLSQHSRSVAEGKQHLPTSNALAFNRPPSSKPPTTTSQPLQKSHNQLPSWQQASSLGGTVSLPSHNFGRGGDNLPNANRTALNSLGVDARQDELGSYLEALKQRVARRWRQENPNSSTHTIIVFAVSRSGQITPPRIIRSSGSLKVDQAALQAVEQAAPFEPLPESFREAQLNIEFTFNILDIDVDRP